MKSIKLFLTLFILNSSLFIGTAQAQWWTQGGNLIWPYGDVTILKNLNVDGTINGVKKYVAMLTQNGSASAPTVSVLENTLGGNVVWTRYSNGVYMGTLASTFPEAKTICSAGNFEPNGDATIVEFVRNGSDDQVVLRSYDNAVSLSATELGATVPIEIRVYP